MMLKERPLTSFPLEELSWEITKHASVVSQYLAAHNLPQPSVGSDGPSTTVPVDAPVHIRRSLQNLLSASLEIFQLALGPSEFVSNLATGVSLALLPSTRNTDKETSFNMLLAFPGFANTTFFV